MSHPLVSFSNSFWLRSLTLTLTHSVSAYSSVNYFLKHCLRMLKENSFCLWSENNNNNINNCSKQHQQQLQQTKTIKNHREVIKFFFCHRFWTFIARSSIGSRLLRYCTQMQTQMHLYEGTQVWMPTALTNLDNTLKYSRTMSTLAVSQLMNYGTFTTKYLVLATRKRLALIVPAWILIFRCDKALY